MLKLPSSFDHAFLGVNVKFASFARNSLDPSEEIELEGLGERFFVSFGALLHTISRHFKAGLHVGWVSLSHTLVDICQRLSPSLAIIFFFLVWDRLLTSCFPLLILSFSHNDRMTILLNIFHLRSKACLCIFKVCLSLFNHVLLELQSLID